VDASTSFYDDGTPGIFLILNRVDSCTGEFLFGRYLDFKMPQGSFSINKNLSGARLAFSDQVSGVSINLVWTGTTSGEKGTNTYTTESPEGTMKLRITGTNVGATVAGSVSVPDLGTFIANNVADLSNHSLHSTTTSNRSISKRE
jgi:hypothetical protein